MTRAKVTVGIAAAAGTLLDLQSALVASGHTVVRFDASRFVPVLSRGQLRRLREDRWDGILVSSPRVLELFLEPVYRNGLGSRPLPVAYVAGESTATGAARLGFPVVGPSQAVGLSGIAEGVPSDRPLRLLHPRSDAAGPALARLLRAKGHTVRDVVAFRTVRATAMAERVRSGFGRAGLVVVSSPLALAGIRRHLGAMAFRALASTVPFRVLGSATERAARRAGVRDVGPLDPGPGQRFTPATVGFLFDARAPAS